MSHIVCFTGHREIPDTDYTALQVGLEKAVEEQISAGASVFRAGGARGFDTLAAIAVLLLRRKYPHIRLELLLPCPSQADAWRANDRALYEQILSQADCVTYISQHYYRGVLHVRNRALVDGADVCIAYLRNSVGGTAYTASYALKNGVQLINLCDQLPKT